MAQCQKCGIAGNHPIVATDSLDDVAARRLHVFINPVRTLCRACAGTERCWCGMSDQQLKEKSNGE